MGANGKIAHLPLTNLPPIVPIARGKAKIRPLAFVVFVANVAILTQLDKTEKKSLILILIFIIISITYVGINKYGLAAAAAATNTL